MGHGASILLYDFANGDAVNRFYPDGRFGKDIDGNPYSGNRDEYYVSSNGDWISLVLQSKWHSVKSGQTRLDNA
jgi:hypothetical protein